MGFFDDDFDNKNNNENENDGPRIVYRYAPSDDNGNGGGDGGQSVRRVKKWILISAIVMAVVMVLTVVLCAVITTVVLNEKVEEAVSDYQRVYYLPENYSNSTLSVLSANLDSVLELTCTATISGQSVKGQATGFIITDDGYVITNCHVVTYEQEVTSGRGWWETTTIETGEYDTIVANFLSGSSLYKEGGYKMKLISSDSRNDLALLQFVDKPASVKPLTFCNSNLLVMGEEAIVIGNAGGYGISVTNGVISSPYRKFTSTDTAGTFTKEVLQTNAALNPGNSGGPICNIYNEVVGVATFKIATQENEGLGFGVLSNVVTSFIDGVAESKHITVNYKVSNRGE